MAKRISVTSETKTGRNVRFRNNVTGTSMSRSEFVRKIENGHYPNYHVRNINNVKTPASNPDNSVRNNLD